MKSTQYFLFLILIIPRILAGGQDSLGNRDRGEPSDSSRPYLVMAYGAHFMERIGAENVRTLQYGISRVEDNLLGTRWFSEQTLAGKVRGVLVRTVKTSLLDWPLDAYTYIFLHEYYGHGQRFQEITDREIKYHLTMPLYGGKHNWTYVDGVIPASFQGMMTVYAGGIEAQTLLNRDLALDWMTMDRMHYRETLLYFLSFLNYYPLTVHTKGGMRIDVIQDDPSGYLWVANLQAGITDVHKPILSQSAFHSRMALSIANPFIFYSLYSFFKTYLWDGEAVSRLPVLQIGSVRYLPALRSGMTPFGIEYHLENYVRYGNTTSLIDVRVGDPTLYTSWGGLGLSVQNIASWNSCSADVNVNVWKQPKIMIDGNELLWGRSSGSVGGTPGPLKGGGLGGAIALRTYYRFGGLAHSVAAMAEVGYKSIGFLEGYSLDASPVLTIGLAFHPQ